MHNPDSNSPKPTTQALNTVPNQSTTTLSNFLTFEPSITQFMLAKLLNNQMYERLNCKTWRISQLYFQRFAHLLKHVQIALCEDLACSQCHIQDLRPITPPSYQNLKQLELTKNNITSLESLTFIDMDLVEKIYLTSNQITQLKSFSKTKWANLKLLDLAWNHINQGQLEKFKTGRQINELSFDMNPLGGRQLGFFIKLETAEVSNLDQVINHKIFYIKQENLKKKVLQKYHQTLKKRSAVGFGYFWGWN